MMPFLKKNSERDGGGVLGMEPGRGTAGNSDG